MADDDAPTSPSADGAATTGGTCAPPAGNTARRSIAAAAAAVMICVAGYLYATGGGERNGTTAPAPAKEAAPTGSRDGSGNTTTETAVIARPPDITPPAIPVAPRDAATSKSGAPKSETAEATPNDADAKKPEAPPAEAAAAKSTVGDRRPAPARLRETVAAVAGTLTCSDLRVTTEGGAAVVRGVVATAGEAGKVAAKVEALRLDPPPTLAVAVEPQPFCAALVALNGSAGGGTPPAAAAPTITLNRADGVYANGENFQTTVTLPPAGTGGASSGGARGGGHLTVDFLDQAGPVVHMLPTPLRADEARPAGTAVTLGADPASAGPKDRYYTVSPPFGRAMVLAIVADSPLFDQPRPEQEEAQAYVRALSDAIGRARQAGRNVHAATVFLETRER